MRRMKVAILPAGLRLANELLENPDLPKAEIHAVVDRLGKYADALAFAGYPHGDTELANNFIDVLKLTQSTSASKRGCCCQCCLGGRRRPAHGRSNPHGCFETHSDGRRGSS